MRFARDKILKTWNILETGKNQNIQIWNTVLAVLTGRGGINTFPPNIEVKTISAPPKKVYLCYFVAGFSSNTKTNAGTACRSWTRCRWFGEAASWSTPCRGCSYSFSTHWECCRLPFVISQEQYQGGSQADITRRERWTLQTMVWQFSFCSTASPLPWSTSSYLIPPYSWWPQCKVLAIFRPNSYQFFFQTCIAWFLVGLLYFPRWCMPSLLLEAFGRHCPCWSLTTVPLVQGQIFQRFKTTWNSITTQTETHILIWIQIILGKLTPLPHRIRFMEHRYVPLS